MRIYSLLAGLGLCCGLTGVANAKIVTGTSEGYLSRMYAMDLTGRLFPEYDAACKSAHSALVNSYFYTDFRVNTDSQNNVAFIRFGNAETQLANGGYSVESHKYVFSSNELPANLRDSNVKSVEFTLDYDMWHAAAKVVFNPETTKPHTDSDHHHGDCNCDCHNHHGDYHAHGSDGYLTQSVQYQCVLSTY